MEEVQLPVMSVRRRPNCPGTTECTADGGGCSPDLGEDRLHLRQEVRTIRSHQRGYDMIGYD